MEAESLHTVTDLIAYPDERAELINGEIVRRPIARAEHGMAQGNTREVLGPVQRKDGPGGWWIATEVSVTYDAHQRPSHDLAGGSQPNRLSVRGMALPHRCHGLRGDSGLHPAIR